MAISIQNIINSLFQIITKLLMIIFKVIFRPKGIVPEGLKIPPGTLILSSHQNFLDPWLVSIFIPMKHFLHLTPLKFPVTHKFMVKASSSLLIWCFGGYDIGHSSFDKSKKLLYTRNLIQKGYTVMLFPEGRISTNEEIGEFKKGMHILAQENISLVLVKISGIKSKYDFGNITLKYSDLIEKEVNIDEKIRRIQEFFEIK